MPLRCLYCVVNKWFFLGAWFLFCITVFQTVPTRCFGLVFSKKTKQTNKGNQQENPEQCSANNIKPTCKKSGTFGRKQNKNDPKMQSLCPSCPKPFNYLHKVQERCGKALNWLEWKTRKKRLCHVRGVCGWRGSLWQHVKHNIITAFEADLNLLFML